jgi:hypothetical protein
MKEKECPACHNTFKPTKSVQMYCNRKCRFDDLRHRDKTCVKCNVSFHPKKKEQKHCSFKCSGNGRPYRGDKVCPSCQIVFHPKRSIQLFCSRKCSDKSRRGQQRWSNFGREGGKKASSLQIRRSKNETYFANLCEQVFDEVATNIPMFDGWDADVILGKEKIAILWNGIWHYKQISKSQSLVQVQARDKIKIKVIKKANYEPYVIKDLGQFNPEFVENEFEKFLYFALLQ